MADREVRLVLQPLFDLEIVLYDTGERRPRPSRISGLLYTIQTKQGIPEHGPWPDRAAVLAITDD